MASAEPNNGVNFSASKISENAPKTGVHFQKMANLNSFLTPFTCSCMFNGHDIADRIHFNLKSTKGATSTELGGLLGAHDEISAKSKRKRYADFLRKLRQEKIIKEVRTTSEYLKLPVMYILLGEYPHEICDLGHML